MITETQLNTIFTAMGHPSTGINIVIIRANQKVKKLPRVYGTFNVPFEDADGIHQSEQTVAADNPNRNADVSRWESSRATVTLKFYGDRGSDYALVRQAVNNAINWIANNEVSGVVLQVISPQVRDETAFIEQNYQYVMSIDIRVDLCQEHVTAVEAIERLEATPTVDGDVEATVIVDQNNT